MNSQTAFNLINKDGQHFKNKDGNTLFFYNNGNKGKPPMLFLHTLRTQAEFHHKILPDFNDDYDCYLVDWPGHGRSSKDPSIAYTAQYMVKQILEFIEEQALKDLIIVGESIGATGALSIAAKIPSKVKSVYASNPYDEGFVIGKLAGKIVSWLGGKTPILNKDEVKPITKILIGGGFHDRSQLDNAFIDLISENANKDPYFGRALYSFLANQKSWHDLREYDYPQIGEHVSVHLLYGEQDWSAKWVREENKNRIGGKLTVIDRDEVGHFSFLEKPEQVVSIIKRGESV